MLDELKIYDFDKSERVQRFYGGASGNKTAIEIDGDIYLVKYPQNLKEMNMQIPVSYGNNAISEFIGSHFYKYAEIPVHDTYLGTSRGKLVVACKDFCNDGKMLFEFSKCVNSYFPSQLDNIVTPDSSSSSNSTNLEHCLDVIENLDSFESIREQLKARFWDMFVIDSIIANPDRNCGNWGVLINSDKKNSMEIAPVYDNGNSLNSKWNDAKMELILHSDEKEQKAELSRTVSVFTTLKNGTEHRINPFRFMQTSDNPDLQDAIIRLMPRLKEAVRKTDILLGELPVLSETQKAFYAFSLALRVNDILLPIYDRLMEKRSMAGI